MIRDARPEDYGLLLPMLLKLHSSGPFGHLEPDEPMIRRCFITSIYFDNGYAKVVEHKGKIRGCLVGIASPNVMGVNIAQDLFTFASIGTDLLIKDFKAWAKQIGCHGVQITDFSGKKRYHKLIEATGPKHAGTVYMEAF